MAKAVSRDMALERFSKTDSTAVLVVDRRYPFDPYHFIDMDWVVVAKDMRANTLSTVDFTKVSFDNGLTGSEISIHGQDKLKQFRSDGRILLDALTGKALFEEKGQATLQFLYNTRGIQWMEFAGTVLRNDGGDGCEYLLYLCRCADGCWRNGCKKLDGLRDVTHLSPLIDETKN